MQPAPSPPAQELVWAPKPDVLLRREMVTKHTLSAKSQVSEANGERVVSQRLFDLDSTQYLTVTDRVFERADGRPTKMNRMFNECRFEANTETSAGGLTTKDGAIIGDSGFVGRSVMFTWVPEDKEYGRYYDKKNGIEELLPGLSVSMSMRELMPKDPVKLGSSWDMAPGVLAGVFNSGGDTDMELGNGVKAPLYRIMRLGTGLSISNLFGEKEEGTVKATWIGTEESSAGRMLALLKLDFDVTLERDMRDRADGSLMLKSRLAGIRIESALVQLKLQGSGTVRWDLEGAHLHDVQDFRADEEVSTKLVQYVDGPDGKVHSSQELVMFGWLEHKVSVLEEQP